MSQTARERYNPPSRRKSCAGCTRARRRCDLGLPECSRCAQRRIPCDYPNRQRISQRQYASQGGPAGGRLLGHDVEPNEFAGRSHDDTNTIDPSLILNTDAISHEFSTEILTLDDSGVDFNPNATALTAPSMRHLPVETDLVGRRLQYAIDEIRQTPLAMVLETQTPWCHHSLYREHMPRSMQDAHSSCALYTLKNRTNAPIILRSIEQRVQDLLSSPSPVGPLECLAHTHSLILYMIMRLFDGDIRARSDAERDIPAFEQSAIDLLPHVHFDSSSSSDLDLPLFPLGATQAFWKDWMFQESARRTLLFTFFFLQTYHHCSSNRRALCDDRMHLCQSWTASAHLWHAKSPAEFALAWKDKRHFVVENASFQELILEARADDVDRFGRILLSGVMGVAEAEAWFVMRGGSLRERSADLMDGMEVNRTQIQAS